MAKQRFYFLAKEDPGRLNPYTLEQLRTLFKANLVDVTTLIQPYEGGSSVPLGKAINLKTWQEAGPLQEGSAAPQSRLKRIGFLALLLLAVEMAVLTFTLGSVSLAIEWNGEQLRAGWSWFVRTVSIKPEAPARTLRYSGDIIALQAPCEWLPKPGKGLVTFHFSLSAAGEIAKRLVVAGKFEGSDGSVVGMILTSGDAGLTWVEAGPASKGLVYRGVVASKDRLALVGEAKRAGESWNPFLATTSDGVSFDKKPLRNYEQPGSINAIQIESPEWTALLFDPTATGESRNKQFTSTDLGETWHLAEYGKAGSPKPLSTVDPDLRIENTMSASTLRHRREPRKGARDPLATFAAETGACESAR